MIEEKILIDLGLTEIEAKTYLACLELGSDTVQNIAKKGQIKRPTCYVTLDNLFTKGYVAKIEKKSTTLYAAEDPKIMLNKYKEKITNFNDFLPYFETKFAKTAKPKIKYYEGKEELWNVYTKIVFPSKEIYFFGTNYQKINKIFPNLIEYWAEHFSDKYKIYKEIVSYDKYGLKYLKENARLRPMKMMPKNLPVFADSAITENKIFIISLDNLFGVLIESEDLAKTYKNFFLLAWQSALEIKEIVWFNNYLNH